MPRAKDVKPKQWTNIKVLFDNREYSVIWGEYEVSPGLGERWNGDSSGVGFPHQGKYPTWHVIPEFLWGPILLGILSQLSIGKYLGFEEHEKNTRSAIASLLNPKH